MAKKDAKKATTPEAAPSSEAAAVANLAAVNSTGRAWWQANSEVPPGSRVTVEAFEDGRIRFTLKGLSITLQGEASGKIES